MRRSTHARGFPNLSYRLLTPRYCKVALDSYYVNSEGEDISALGQKDITTCLDLGNLFAHLTNASIQKQHPRYREQRGQHIWSLAQADADCRKQGKLGSAAADDTDDSAAPSESIWPGIHHKMKTCLAWIYKATRSGEHSLQRRHGYY